MPVYKQSHFGSLNLLILPDDEEPTVKVLVVQVDDVITVYLTISSSI